MIMGKTFVTLVLLLLAVSSVSGCIGSAPSTGAFKCDMDEKVGTCHGGSISGEKVIVDLEITTQGLLSGSKVTGIKYIKGESSGSVQTMVKCFGSATACTVENNVLESGTRKTIVGHCPNIEKGAVYCVEFDMDLHLDDANSQSFSCRSGTGDEDWFCGSSGTLFVYA